MSKTRNLHLIEFGGIPGAGKSTVFKEVNEYLYQKLGYYPGPKSEWARILDDLPQEESDILIPRRLRLILKFFIREKIWLKKNLAQQGLWEESLRDFSGLIQFILETNQIPMEEEELRLDRNTVTNYLMKLLQFYCYVQNHTEREFLMFSEGFYKHLKMFVWMASKSKTYAIAEILNLCPSISLFIYLDVNISVAYQRIMERPDGPPPQYRNYNKEHLMDLLKRAYDSDLLFLKLLEENGIKVVRLENNQNKNVALLEVLVHLENLISLK